MYIYRRSQLGGVDGRARSIGITGIDRESAILFGPARCIGNASGPRTSPIDTAQRGAAKQTIAPVSSLSLSLGLCFSTTAESYRGYARRVCRSPPLVTAGRRARSPLVSFFLAPLWVGARVWCESPFLARMPRGGEGKGMMSSWSWPTETNMHGMERGGEELNLFWLDEARDWFGEWDVCRGNC